MPLFSHPPKSICVLRLSAIGDVCHALAAVQQIHQHWPSTQITWIIGKNERALFEHITDINFVVYDKKSGLKGIFDLWKKLKDQHFDALLNMQTALRASIISLGIKATYKIGFGKKRSREGQYLVVNHRITDPQNPHVLDGFMAFVEELGVPTTKPHWKLNIPLEIQQKVQQYINPKQQTLIISPCSSKAEKDWTISGYAQVADIAHLQHKQVIFCGAPAPREMAMVEQIIQACHFKPLNLCGKTSLIEFAALISQADLVLAPDSGPAHLATLGNTPVIGLYAYHNPQRTGPYNDLDNVVSVYDQCLMRTQEKTAKDMPWATKVKGENLMAEITSDMVIHKMQEIGFFTK